MKHRRFFSDLTALAVFLSVTLSLARSAPPTPSAAGLLANLKKEHPRLLLTQDKIADLKTRITTDPTLKAWYAKIKAHGQAIMPMPVIQYQLDLPETNLPLVRQTEDRIRTLGFLYLMEGGQAYADRAWQELDAAAHLPNWDPKHFLDVGEMTLTFGLAYDWFYAAWTPEQRTELRQAMLDKGLNVAIANPWWIHLNYNWNFVCSGGIGVGALAIADEEPEVSAKALQIALTSFPYALASYAPDGAWPEGIGYWDYATTFAAYFIDALETSTGSDAGLAEYPGFSQTGLYPLEMTGPIGIPFNFSDAGAYAVNSPVLFWLAQKFNEPLCAAYQIKHAAPSVMDLIWYPANGASDAGASAPLGVVYSNINVFCNRGSWTDHKTSFVGFKGGDNKANHSHLDLGSFVFDADGARFARLGGADSYVLPGYFDLNGPRYTYYRIRAEGANTLVINPGPGPDQDPKAAAPIIKSDVTGDRPFAIADLTAAYAKDASSVHRGVAMIGGRQLLVQDEIQTPKPAEVWWFMHTKATIDSSSQSSDGRTITLSEVDPTQIPLVQLKAQILSPPGARFEVMAAAPLPGTNPPPKQTSNPDVQKLAIHLSGVSNSTIVVTLTPVMPETASFTAPPLIPLSQW